MVMGLVIFLLYYAVLSGGMNMGKYNGVNPLYCIWAPNLVFLLLGLEAFHLAAQERMPHALEWRGDSVRQKNAGTVRKTAIM